ncbi:MAG: spore coat protein CotJB [Firmicutes bacterium]|nr:spore coat protein CotJB [Bacillota bacterium]
MNNYPNFKNYNNYTNSNMMPNVNLYNKQITPFNSQYKDYNNMNANTNLYDPYNGLIRGNMFKNLYDPYKSGEPYDIKPMNAQAEDLTNIDALSFAMVDLGLLLDVNPNNQDAIKLFNQYREQKENLIKEYESKYGPITLDSDSLNSYPWAWKDMPWPWDN